MPSAVALVPARAGSERVPRKNVRPLRGHPLLAYAIAGAQESDCFDSGIIVSTDSEQFADVARHYGAEVIMRPAEMASATSPDIDWVRHALELLRDGGDEPEVFGLLRPTSPFRNGDTIRRAWEQLLALGDGADSIRAVEKCRQHPAKMWRIEGDLMEPLLEQPEDLPLHSRQYKSLPEVYVQNSSVEIAWTRAVTEQGTISGRRVAPFLTDAAEGFSVDYPDDWAQAEALLESGEARLPSIDREPYELGSPA